MLRDSKGFRDRFQRWKAGEKVYDAGRIPEYRFGKDEEPADAIQVQQRVPLEIQNDPLLIQRNTDRLNQVRAKNQTYIGKASNTPQQLQDYYRDKEETARFMARKKAGEQAADELMMSFFDPRYVAAGWLAGKGAQMLGKMYKAAKNFNKNYRLAKAIDKEVQAAKLEVPNIQEQSLYLKPSNKQIRIVPEDTYPLYIGPKHSVSEVVNADGTINPRAAMKIQHEVADNIPGAYRMEARIENPQWHKNDPTTYHHTKNVAQSAWETETPDGYTKQDQMIAALGHDFGKLVAGDGHGKIGAALLKQIFTDISDDQLKAVSEHMNDFKNINNSLSIATKTADIANGNRPSIVPLKDILERSIGNAEKAFYDPNRLLKHNKIKDPIGVSTVLDLLDIEDFLKSEEYRERLYNYFKNVRKIPDEHIDYYVNREISYQIDGIRASSYRIVDGERIDGSHGRFDPGSRTISVNKDYIYRDTPQHEMIHASDDGVRYLDNQNYAMDAVENDPYYADIVEQRPRVLLTLKNMRKHGYKINDLTQQDVDQYFDVGNYWMRSENERSLFDNYKPESWLKALRGFKSVLVPITMGGSSLVIPTFKNSKK